jgi:hypothetical protein
MTLTPDLTFESLAVGDIKYKVVEEWVRTDLYQAVTFAEAFQTRNGAIIGFATEDRPELPPVIVGKIELTHFCWTASSDIAPQGAATFLADRVDRWLARIHARQVPS